MGSRDWISSLPDEILGKIMSLVPTKLAASTSVLSKRWRNLNVVGLVDTFCFDESMVAYPNEEEAKSGSGRFLDFLVNTLLRNSSTNMKKFSLRYGPRIGLEDYSHVYDWIWTATERGLLELHLERTREIYFFKRELLTSNTLVKLTLSGHYGFGEVDSFFFPALKSLSILSVLGLGFDRYPLLINGCPVLEELVVTDDDHDDKPYAPCCTTCVESPSVKRLVVSIDYPFDDYSEESCEIAYFETPRLVYLDYSSCVFADYKLVDLDSLVEVKLHLRLWPSTNDEPIFGNVTKLLAGLSNITTIHLSPDSLEAIHFCCKSMPKFNNLLNLYIESNKEKGWQVMPRLLNRCPNLRTLAIKGLLHRVTYKCGDACACIPNKKVACCLRTCQVKVLEISEYGGSLQELKQMRHFLGKLECLETVKVGVDADTNRKFLRANLLALPIISSKCNNIQFI